jgi:hypothetical protein
MVAPQGASREHGILTFEVGHGQFFGQLAIELPSGFYARIESRRVWELSM